ncbi:MAG TPA: hypothetical protein VHB98_05340 [Chloroflexota bacterium]|nr:hypothetical protein [Chloroflexota bacterium]
MEQDFLDAGIVQIPSTMSQYNLTAIADLEDLTALAAPYRCKPVVLSAGYDDVPDADETENSTEDLVEFVHRLGYLFNWDDATGLWAVSGVRDGFPDDSEDMPAADQRTAAIEAIRYLVE